MENQTTTAQAEVTSQETANQAAQLEQLKLQLKGEQNLPLGVVVSLVAALVGAALWTTVTVLTEYQIGYMAIGVGFLVGFANRYLGKGIDPIYGYIGGGFALLGCLIGNLLTICFFAAKEASVPFSNVLTSLTPSAIIELLKISFQPMDLLFYGLAIYAGYRYSFRKIA